MVLGDLNARLHRALQGEGDVIGQYVFKSGHSQFDMGSNRELLVELCTAHDLAVANTFFDVPMPQLVTYRGLGVVPMSEVSGKNFAQLDFMLIPQAELTRVRTIRSYRSEPLRSQHFILMAEVMCDIVKRPEKY